MEAGYLAAAAAEPGRRRWSAFVFRSFDIAASGLLLLLLAPVLAIVAVAVRLDSSGPAIFRQERLGRGMVPFDVLKFRTMRTGSDSAPHREYVRTLIADAASPPESTAHAGNGGLFKLAVDDRVTRVGRFLRTWSLDELPQLWNVLRGDMSLVGPRPVIPYEVEFYPEWYFGRFAVKPGLTGLWQVSGRNERTYEEMVRFDVDYIEQKSFALDLRILARTALVVARRQGVA
jgi:lipopolysaccharide/colanic/teichoic acid biosynthesis glycosyltransferase